MRFPQLRDALNWARTQVTAAPNAHLILAHFPQDPLPWSVYNFALKNDITAWSNTADNLVCHLTHNALDVVLARDDFPRIQDTISAFAVSEPRLPLQPALDAFLPDTATQPPTSE